MELTFGGEKVEIDIVGFTEEELAKAVQRYIDLHCRKTQSRQSTDPLQSYFYKESRKQVNETIQAQMQTTIGNFVKAVSPSPFATPDSGECSPEETFGLDTYGIPSILEPISVPVSEPASKASSGSVLDKPSPRVVVIDPEAYGAAMNSLRYIGTEPWDLEIQNNPNYHAGPATPPARFHESDIRDVGWLGDSFAAIPRPPYQRNSAQPWKGDVELHRRRAAAEAVLPALQRVVEGSDEMTVAARGMATAWNQGAVPALQSVVDPIRNVKGGFDELIGGLMVTGQSSSELREVLPADAEAMGDGVYHGLEPAKVGFNELTGDMSDLIEMALRMPEVMEMLPSISFGEPEDGSTSTSGDDGQGSSGNTDGGEPDRVSYDKALDHYQQTSGENAENIAWMRANPDDKIASGPNKGWTFTKLMRDHVNKGGGKPGFAMGGVVPGPIGAPVPALLHGGERVLRSGQSGGGPTNVTLHVHGNVVSERELVRSVREGLIRLNREVTEMGF